MPTLFNPSERQKMAARIAQLTPESRPLWGSMNASQVQTHLADQLRLALGDLACKSKKTPFRYPPLRELIVYILPWPKGVPTAPELLATSPAEWEKDREALLGQIERFGTRTRGGSWPEHPAFGRLSGRAWGVLAWRHLDHHLRQFGV
jgi:hypothetical protein